MPRNKNIIYKVLLVLICCTPAFTQAVAPVPQQINYQGKLTDATGKPLATADYTLTFKIYNAASGGALVWGPQVFDGAATQGHGAQVPVVRGFFNIILGPVDTAGVSIDKAFAAPNRYLEITVGSNPPVSPRQQILSTAFALKALSAYGEVPVGGIVPYFGSVSSLAANWKYCDGSAVSDPESPLNGQVIPDLRSRFVRGTSGANGFGYGGGDTHSHYNSSSSLTSWIPRRSVDSWVNAYQKASSASGFFPNIYTLTYDSNDTIPKDSHGHTGGVVYGYTNSSYNVPAYYALNYIIRIK